MSADILAAPHLNVRFTREVQEDGGEGEENQVEILDEEEHLGSEKARPHAPKNPAVVKRRYFKAAAVTLGGMYLLILAGIFIRYISVTLEKKQLQQNYSELEGRFSDVAVNYSQLQSSYETLNKNHSQLQDEVKQLKDKMEDKQDVAVKYSQLQSSYETLSENHSQLQDEVKQLKDKMEGKWCPDGWERFGCSCYFKSTEMKRWWEGRKHCQDNGADLLVINNKEEQDFIVQLNQKGEYWIGLSQKWTETGSTGRWVWRWVDGSPLTETFWASGHPQSSGYYATCCNEQGKWTSHYYDVYKPWICEK